jgi:mannose-6-phosphate isomerase-like protein (cupin superfamily)
MSKFKYRRGKNMDKINLKEKLSKFSDHWSPKIIAEMNDYQFKLVKIQGEFVWHNHEDTDEVFIVIEGKMKIEFENETIELNEGEMYVVPKGIQHKPYAETECKVMLVEPRGVVNTGNTEGELTASNDVWI